MPNTLDSLKITTLFESPVGDGISNQYYREVILRALKKTLPTEFFDAKESEEKGNQHRKQILKRVIPLITCSKTCFSESPNTLSFFALSKYRSNSFKFFFDMISRWLIPGKRVNVVLVYASDFRLTHLNEEIYTICELMINVDDRAEFEQIQKNFPIIETEIKLGIHSQFYAQRIMEVKGLTCDDKTALIQEFIALLVKRFPKSYDNDVFTEMQHVLVTCRDEFKALRKARHLSRMISIQYLFRKGMRTSLKRNSQLRYLHLKIFRAFIQTQNGHKRVLCILVGLNFIREQETFGEKNLFKAIEHFIPNILSIENSFLSHKLSSENICFAYLEVEKKDGTPFSFSEIRKLKRELPANLKNRVENRLHSVFMPRNEEEVIRNILTLSSQIKFMRDIPQVSIIFDEQAPINLYFTVILVRLLKPGARSIAELFKKSESKATYIHDRTKTVGYVRKKHPKEAVVFRLKLPKEGFLRTDYSIDLYKARQAVVKEITSVVGEIRDYNGGMISKQRELFSSIRELLSDQKEYDDLLLENFFYSLMPIFVRAVVDPQTFKILFLMLLEGLKEYKADGVYLKTHADIYNVFALLIIEDLSLKDQIHRKVQELRIPPSELAHTYIKANGYQCMGYICCAHDSQKKEQLFATLSDSLKGPLRG